jgi:CelD/BcsL family acetyltransferase involved in cellulose biosynthesis
MLDTKIAKPPENMVGAHGLHQIKKTRFELTGNFPQTSVDGPQLRVQAITDELVFEHLQEPWNRLATRGSTSVFLQHEWFSAAWAWRRSDASLWILCVYLGEVMKGVLPLIRPRQSRTGCYTVEFLAVPDTQRCDLIADTHLEGHVCSALARYLLNSSEWRVLCLDRLRPRSLAETALLPRLVTRGIQCYLEATDCNPYVDLETTWEDYYATRTRSHKKAQNLAANRLSRTGRLQIEQYTPSPSDAHLVHGLLQEIVAVSARSWKRDTGNSLDAPRPLAFIQRLTEVALPRGWLCLWLLRLDNRPVAVEYQLSYRGEVHALRGDFDHGYKHLSPGSYLNRHVLEKSFSAGLKRYYMGPGPNAYKKRWSDIGETLYRLSCYAPTLRSRAFGLWTHELKPRLRKLRDHIVAS